MKILHQIRGFIRFQKLAMLYCPSYALVLIALTIFKAISPFIAVILPRYILDEVFGNRDISRIVLYLAVMGVATVICGILNAILDNNIHFISMKFKARLGRELASQTTKISYEKLEDASILNIKQNAEAFVQKDIDKAVLATPLVFSSFIAALGYIYIISNLNVIILLSLCGVIAITTILESHTEKYAYSFRKEVASVECELPE